MFIYLIIYLFSFQLRKKIIEKSKDGTLNKNSSNGDGSKGEQRKRGRWDQTIDDQFVPAKKIAGGATPSWENDVSTLFFFCIF